MAVDTIAGLKAKMPANTPGGTTIADMHDFLDTVEEFTTQRVSEKTASYIATGADNRTFFTINVSTSNTFTVSSSVPVGWECAILQTGAGQTSIVVQGTGANLRHPDAHTRISKQYGMVYLKCFANAGTAPQLAFTGDTSA